MSKSQRPDDTVAGSTKELASRFYQLKTGHCRTRQYLHWTKARPTAQCWWCRCPRQTRDHLLKECPRWKEQQKTLWRGMLEKLLAPRQSLGWRFCFTVLLRTRLHKSGEVRRDILLFFLYFSSSSIYLFLIFTTESIFFQQVMSPEP